MKTLDEIRNLYVNARSLARVGTSVDRAEAASAIEQISEHCKEMYALTPSYLERAKWRNMYESFDTVAAIIRKVGFSDKRIQAFFGFIAASAAAPSFGDISKGNGTVIAPEIVGKSEKKGEEGKPKASRPLPPPPAPEKPVCEGTSPYKNAESPEIGGDGAQQIVKGTPAFVPTGFADFIGQEHVVKRLAAEIKAARKQGIKHIDHVMLFGNRGLGKSTLMKLTAAELGVKFEFIDASSLGNDVRSQRAVQKFFQRIASEGEPVVIGFDEIHALPRHIQTSLLTLLNDRVFSYVDENGATKNIEIPDFTFIGATTDSDAVLPTLKDRCNNLTFMLKDYTRDELRRIFVNKLASKGLSASASVLEKCVNRCRSSIREVDAFVNGLNTKAVLSGERTVTDAMADEYFRDVARDAIGLKDKDREILGVLAADHNGVMSEDTLAARVYLDPKVLTKEFEPYLLKIGFIAITSRGRSLTPKAEKYLRHGYFEFDDGTTVGSEGGSAVEEFPLPEGGEDAQ